MCEREVVHIKDRPARTELVQDMHPSLSRVTDTVTRQQRCSDLLSSLLRPPSFLIFSAFRRLSGCSRISTSENCSSSSLGSDPDGKSRRFSSPVSSRGPPRPRFASAPRPRFPSVFSSRLPCVSTAFSPAVFADTPLTNLLRDLRNHVSVVSFLRQVFFQLDHAFLLSEPVSFWALRNHVRHSFLH